MPPMLSLWPFRYFVVLCRTRSQPNASGRCSAGLANVLSTTTATLRRWATSAAAARSVSVIIGLVGVSSRSSRVAGWIAAATASMSLVST